MTQARWISWLVAAGASLGLAWRFGAAPGDGFSATLVLVPLVAAAFAELESWCRRTGGGSIPLFVSRAQALAAGLLVLAGGVQRSLGLALAEPAVVAGLFLVLAHRVGVQLLAARPLLGRELPLRPPAVFFVLPLIAYLSLVPWSTAARPPDGDEPYYLLITHSLVHDFDAELTNNYAAGDARFFLDRPLAPQPGDPRGPDGTIYSRHNELLPMVLAPGYWLAGKLGALATMALLTALTAWMTLRVARHYFPDRPGEALVAYAIFAFSPPLILYATQVWVEVPAALLGLLVVDRVHWLARAIELDTAKGAWNLRSWLSIGLPLILLPLLKIRFMLLALPLLFLAWWYARRPWKPLLILCCALALVGGGILVFNTLQFGNPLKIHGVEELALHQRSLDDYLEGALGLFFDAAFGLLPNAPVWLLLVPALVALGRLRTPLLRDGSIFALPYLIVVVPRGEWYGGWSPPFRYGLFVLPFLALALIPLLAERHRPGRRTVLLALGMTTLLLTVLWLTVPGWTYNFADGRTYLLDHLGRATGADVARFFPSSVRPRLATWLWPPILVLASFGLWRWPLPLRRRALVFPIALAAICGLLVAVPLLAHRWPTRWVECEDAQVVKELGHAHPDRWVIERTRHRGGWMLPPNARLSAPVVPGGRQVRLRIELDFVRNSDWPLLLEIRAGDAHLASWAPTNPRHWQTLVLGPFAWPAGAPLVLEAVAEGPRQGRDVNGILVDRIGFEWQD